MEKKQMSQVLECEALDCLYNSDGECRTFAITVGGREPCCDTYMAGRVKGGAPGIAGGVGACHVSTCVHNDRFECTAKGIHVSMHGTHPDCDTYASR